MTTPTDRFSVEWSENIHLLAMLAGQSGTQNVPTEQPGPLYPINTDGYFSAAVPVELFAEIRTNKVVYGPAPYVKDQFLSEEQQKENEWLNLVGEAFYELSPERRDFLIKTAGIFDFGESIDIKKVYKTSIY